MESTDLINAEGCRVWYQAGFLSSETADDMLAASRALPDFVQDRARGVVARRRTAAYGASGLTYRYSQTLKVALPWPVHLLALRAAVTARLGVAFNFALVNLYLDGQAGLGWHADDERDLEAGAPIACVSLGAARVFSLRHLATGAVTGAILSHGSLCVMEGATQQLYHHCITRDARVKMPRVSVTFRRLV